MSRKEIRARAIKALARDGRLTPEALVNAARSPHHPMHNDFIWNDKVAAEKYRLGQARGFIAEVRVVHTTIGITSVAYVRDPAASPEQGYVHITTLRTEQENAQLALAAEITRIKAALERAREIAAVLELMPEYDAAFNALELLAGRIRRGDPGEISPTIM